jgi:hypothetical protein
MSSGSHERGRKGGSRALVIVAVIVFGLGVAALAYVMGGFGSQEAAEEDSAGERSTTDGVEVRDGLADYSWDELSQIASDLSACDSRDAALELAASYNLVNPDGTMTGDTKEVQLDDGRVIQVAIADVYRDAKADGSGTSGLTFVCMTGAGVHQMNDEDTIEGGWESSGMRSWLADEMMDDLPDDLAGTIVSVSKLTNNVGETFDAADVTATSDSLWLLSSREVCGEITWYSDEYGSQYAYRDAVFNAEGEQYALFAEAGVTCDGDPNGMLVRTVDGVDYAWFLRSCENNHGNYMADASYFRSVLDSGYPKAQANPTDELAVVFGFCL